MKEMLRCVDKVMFKECGKVQKIYAFDFWFEGLPTSKDQNEEDLSNFEKVNIYFIFIVFFVFFNSMKYRNIKNWKLKI